MGNGIAKTDRQQKISTSNGNALGSHTLLLPIKEECTIFAMLKAPVSFTRMRINRESGVNPEQYPLL